MSLQLAFVIATCNCLKTQETFSSSLASNENLGFVYLFLWVCPHWMRYFDFYDFAYTSSPHPPFLRSFLLSSLPPFIPPFIPHFLLPSSFPPILRSRIRNNNVRVCIDWKVLFFFYWKSRGFRTMRTRTIFLPPFLFQFSTFLISDRFPFFQAGKRQKQSIVYFFRWIMWIL